MTIDIILRSVHSKPSILADATIVFKQGDLAGLMLTGFTIFKGRGDHPFVTVPSRPYQKNGETKYYWLLRPVDSEDDSALTALRDAILVAYRKVIKNKEVELSECSL